MKWHRNGLFFSLSFFLSFFKEKQITDEDIKKEKNILHIYISLNFYSVFFVSFWENLVRFFSVRVFLTEKSGGEETCWLFYYAERNILTVFSIFFFLYS